ncbi:hydrogenase maturation protease [Thiohalocapsa marina]|uniref:Hydrogenase maturation protease n=2 Tax=Thiohalocapsa marina TaxID=424902 RepID=A0A5M8FMD8_9GAMM|nr:hydrogenase maturation protease [Thiohalocapsa marina]
MGAVAPTLVFGIGNPSRGDDAIGPLLVERLAALKDIRRPDGQGLTDVDLLTDFQLQPEHALDLRGRRRVFLVDASQDPSAPWTLEALMPQNGLSCSTHSTTPGGLLAVYSRLYGRPPSTWLLAVQGEGFALGAGLTTVAQANLNAALQHLLHVLGSDVGTR